MKYCVDCRHVHKFIDVFYCHRPVHVEDRVRGPYQGIRWASCDEERARWIGGCGRWARYFEPKEGA